MRRTLVLLACLLTFSVSSGSVNAKLQGLDSLVFSRLFSYQKNHQQEIKGYSTNVYTKLLHQTHRRNFTLWTVPTMYTIAKGRRTFMSEQYSRFTFNDFGKFENHRQVYYTTIPRNRSTMNVAVEYLVPNFYGPTIYRDHILSPFCRENRVYYRYTVERSSDQEARLRFRPRFIKNTQLVRGQALVHIPTGRLVQVELEGEFDMIHFRTRTMMGTDSIRAFLPRITQLFGEFKFAGNHITTNIESVFDCPITLPDTVNVDGDEHLIDSLRPIPLSAEERFVYANYRQRHPAPATQEPTPAPSGASGDTVVAPPAAPQDTTPTAPTRRHHNYWKEIGWDLIGEHLIRSLRAETKDGEGYVKLSPIINPQYISYSHRKGFSYKMKLGARYNFSPNVFAELNPNIGYNFKLREFYWTVPLYFVYNPRLEGRFMLIWGNDNRIGNASVLDEIRQEHGDLPELTEKQLDIFDDKYIRFTHNIAPLKWLNIEAGLVYHRRRALNRADMERFGKPTLYSSFAPSVEIKLQPWAKAPLLCIDYERGIKGNDVNITYERWEADLSLKHKMRRTQTLNLRVGGGFYTDRNKNYFLDFSNFRDDNLPEGWDDDWTGNFQLLSSDLYNASNYYIRGNVSYEAPMLAAAMVPILGRYIERERVYLSTLNTSRTALYSELGYGFTCRYFSIGLFASFDRTRYKEMGAKFTFELFRRW